MLCSLVERYKHWEEYLSIFCPKDCNLHIRKCENFKSHEINNSLCTVAEKNMWNLGITVLLTMHTKTLITKSYNDSCKSVVQITQISREIWPVNRFDFHHIRSNDSKN